MFVAIIRKIISAVPLLLLVSIIMFTVVQMLPGNAATIILSEATASGEQKEALEQELGLDKPVYEQYWNWLTDFVKGDMGTSFFTKQPVVKRIAERLPVSLELILCSIVLAILIGIPIGILSAVKRNKPIDYVMSTFSMVGVAMPSFWIGMLFIILFSVQLKILPASGFMSFSVNPMANLRSMILPSITLAIALAAPIIRQTRSSMLDTLCQDYIITAEAKGLKERIVFWKHALRNALVPVITAISSQISGMIGGVFVIETVFLLPGMGKSMVDAIYQRDYPIIMATAMVVAFIVVLINMLVDILYIVIDPRISKN